jgi:hypothetical protein
MCIVGLFTLNELCHTERWLIFKGTQKPIKSFSQVLLEPYNAEIIRVYEFRFVNVILQLFKIRLFRKILPSHQSQALQGKLLFISWVKDVLERLFIFVNFFRFFKQLCHFIFVFKETYILLFKRKRCLFK